jgi:hypothetical protein
LFHNTCKASENIAATQQRQAINEMHHNSRKSHFGLRCSAASSPTSCVF